MGLAAKLSEMRMKDPVDGTARVVTVEYPHGAAYQDAQRYVRLDCVVSGPGIEPIAIEHKCTVATSKVPAPNAVLPVLIDRANPKRIVIHWDKVDNPDLNRKDQRSANRRKAEELAAEMRKKQG
jgi:hypothetical protein